MKPNQKLGDQEMQVLGYISQHASISVREVVEHFEKEKGLARTTISTVMERLRKKGFLERKQVEGLFLYSAVMEQEKIVQKKVSDFVDGTLNGSLSPLFNYFFESPDLSKEDLQQLKKIAEKIRRKEGAE